MICFKPLNLAQRGVTLIELIIVMGLLSMFLVIVLSIFTATIDSQVQTESYSSITVDGRFMMARLNYDIARASAVVVPASLSVSCSATLQITVGTNYSYALSGSSLQLNQNDGNGAINLNSDGTAVASPCFQRLGNAGGKDTIRYSFTLTTTANDKTNSTQTFTSTVERR